MNPERKYYKDQTPHINYNGLFKERIYVTHIHNTQFVDIISEEETGFVVEYGVETANQDTTCMEEIPGISILIHRSDEVPGISKGYIQVKTGDQPKILLKPKVTLIAENMKALDPIKLACFDLIKN